MKEQKSILIIEDDPHVLTMLASYFSKKNCNVLAASTGEKGLEMWRENSNTISFVLTDMQLPNGMSGDVIAERIWKSRPEQPVFFMSGAYQGELHSRVTLVEKENFLRKPFSWKALNEMLGKKNLLNC